MPNFGHHPRTTTKTHRYTQAQPGRPKVTLVLTTDEQAHLEQVQSHPGTAQAVARRAAAVLLCARGLDNKAVARVLGLGQATVGRWRQRFITQRLAGLADAPRTGAPRTIRADVVSAIVVATRESRPAPAAHWTTREMAKRTGLSASSIGRIWRAHGVLPYADDHGRAPDAGAACRAPPLAGMPAAMSKMPAMAGT